MGLLDWLTDAVGGVGGNTMQGQVPGAAPDAQSPVPDFSSRFPPQAQPFPNSPPMQGPIPTPGARPPGAGPGANMLPPTPPPGGGGGAGVPMPDVNTPGAPVVDPSFLRQPPLPGPGGIGSDAARAPNQPGPVPLPMARPPGAGPGVTTGMGGIGSDAARAAAQPAMPGMPTDISARGNLPPGAGETQGQGTPGQPQETGVNWLGKLMGVTNKEEAQRAGREIARGMAAAFKNAPSGVGQSKFGAFAGGVGAGMEGAQKETDRTEENQRKDMAQMILANNSQGAQNLNLARTKLALRQAEAVMTGGTGINSPQNLYLGAMREANQAQDVKTARTKLEEAIKGNKPDSPAVKEAQAYFDQVIEAHRARNLIAVGLSPEIGKSIGQLPGMSKETALKGDKLTTAAYNAMPVGGYYINPKTNVLMVKGGFSNAPAGLAAGGAPPTAAPPTAAPPTGAGTPPTPPAPVTAPAGSTAAGENDNTDEEG